MAGEISPNGFEIKGGALLVNSCPDPPGVAQHRGFLIIRNGEYSSKYPDLPVPETAVCDIPPQYL